MILKQCERIFLVEGFPERAGFFQTENQGKNSSFYLRDSFRTQLTSPIERSK